MKLLCQIYKSESNTEMYLYVEKRRGLEAVPEALLKRFGEPEELMLLQLEPGKKLARADAEQVIREILETGYYLQMPPTAEQIYQREGASAMAAWWDSKPLAQLSLQEWELLCDGCAKCCLHKLEDEDSGEIYYTKVRCRYLDESQCRCTDYSNRSVLVPNCITLDRENVGALNWLPSTCAYRLRANNQPLPQWHPLVSGDKNTVHDAQISIRGRAISDEFVHPEGYDEHIITWVE